MRMSYWEYQGTAHTGVARIACSMEGVHAIMYSPVGDTYINSMFSMMEREQRFPPVTTSVLNGQTMGMGINKLPDTIRQVYEDHNPDLMVICCTCSSTLLQEDLAALGRAAGVPTEVLVYAPNPYRVQEDEAADGLLTLLVNRYTNPMTPTARPSVNIIGPTSLGFHNRQDLISLKRMLATLGLEVNVVAPLGARLEDFKKLPQAWATVAPYREMGYDAAIALEEKCGVPAVTSTPIGVMATREWVKELLGALSKFATAHGLKFDAREPALAAFSMDPTNAPSGVPWFSYTADMQSFSSKRVFVFGDYSHATTIARMMASEVDVQVVGAGTYNLKMAEQFQEAVSPYTNRIIVTHEFEEVQKLIEELQPDVVLGTQMERHTSAGFDIPCATISNPIHIEDFPLSYQPFLGYDGSNYVMDRVYATAKLGLEKHLIEMFGDAGLGTKEAEVEASQRRLQGGVATPVAQAEQVEFVTAKALETAPISSEKAQQLQVEGGAAPVKQAAVAVATPAELAWTEEAQKAMKQIPFFVRPKVQKRVEDYARERGYALITLDLVFEVKEKAG